MCERLLVNVRDPVVRDISETERSQKMLVTNMFLN